MTRLKLGRQMPEDFPNDLERQLLHLVGGAPVVMTRLGVSIRKLEDPRVRTAEAAGSLFDTVVSHVDRHYGESLETVDVETAMELLALVLDRHLPPSGVPSWLSPLQRAGCVFVRGGRCEFSLPFIIVLQRQLSFDFLDDTLRRPFARSDPDRFERVNMAVCALVMVVRTRNGRLSLCTGDVLKGARMSRWTAARRFDFDGLKTCVVHQAAEDMVGPQYDAFDEEVSIVAEGEPDGRMQVDRFSRPIVNYPLAPQGDGQVGPVLVQSKSSRDVAMGRRPRYEAQVMVSLDLVKDETRKARGAKRSHKFMLFSNKLPDASLVDEELPRNVMVVTEEEMPQFCGGFRLPGFSRSPVRRRRAPHSAGPVTGVVTRGGRTVRQPQFL